MEQPRTAAGRALLRNAEDHYFDWSAFPGDLHRAILAIEAEAASHQQPELGPFTDANSVGLTSCPTCRRTANEARSAERDSWLTLLPSLLMNALIEEGLLERPDFGLYPNDPGQVTRSLYNEEVVNAIVERLRGAR